MRGYSTILLSAVFAIGLSAEVQAHGSPSRWSAEATELGCWVTSWLGRAADGPDGELAIGMQVVLGRIVPARADLAQPSITQPEIEGATTLNVRIVDPSLKGSTGVTVLRSDGDPVRLRIRQSAGGSDDFPSFYETGVLAESIAASLRAGKVSALAVRGPDRLEVSFPGTSAGLRVGLAMYDACVAAKAALSSS